MSNKGYALIAILVAAAVAGVLPAFAVSELPCPNCVEEYESILSLPIVIWTDKATYNQPDKVTISGHVRNPNPDMHVSIKVTDPTGNIVKIDQLEVDENGDFETILDTGSQLWTKSGVYTVTAQYGGQSRSYKVQFELFAGGECGASKVAAKIGKETYCIPYTVTGASALGATIDKESKSLTVNISAKSDGEITLEIPRSVLDSKSGARDDKFFVLVNGEEDLYTEEKTATTRSVTIQFLSDAEKIEIIGTQVVPEFGAIAALVLAVAIISIIAVSAKTRLRLMPKY